MISGKTRLIAHIGYPTESFRAPMIYNPWFETKGIDAVVVPMGVKADASGFPKVGGSAEVSKFGYSDKTEDFAGGYGAKATAGIHDPGEYTTLKKA